MDRKAREGWQVHQLSFPLWCTFNLSVSLFLMPDQSIDNFYGRNQNSDVPEEARNDSRVSVRVAKEVWVPSSSVLRASLGDGFVKEPALKQINSFYCFIVTSVCV